MLQFPYLLISICSAFHIALAVPLNSTHLHLPTPIYAFSSWPDAPYTRTFGNIQLTICTYGRSAATDLNWEVLMDLDGLRRQVLNTSDRFSGDQVTLYSDIVAMSVIFHDSPLLGRISRKAVGNVISALRADMARFGAREIGKSIVGMENHRSGVFIAVAEIRVAFARVKGTQS